MNLSDVVNRVRIVGHRGADRVGAALLSLAPMGSRLVDVTTLLPGGAGVDHVTLAGNAWFNLYLVGAPRDAADTLSLMHVK